MGALHAGHRSCIEISRKHADIVLASIFVNPTQFGPNEDLDSYPANLDDDLQFCTEWGCDGVFVPDTVEMYPAKQQTWVSVDGVSKPLCGQIRGGHFRGVATVVAKLFNIVVPDTAVFGQKDAQQALVIKAMVSQLNLPVEIRLSPTVREADGLACSSRNRYLNPDERRRAAGIHVALTEGLNSLRSGERDPRSVCRDASERLRQAGLSDVEYVELLNAIDLTAIDQAAGKVILAIAARVGTTRLIDNMVFDIGLDGSVAETLLFE